MIWGLFQGVLVIVFIAVAVLVGRQYSCQCSSSSKLLGLGFCGRNKEIIGPISWCNLDFWCWKIDLCHSLKIKIKVCPALQANEGHNVVLTGGGVLSSFFGRESVNGFGAIRVGILV